MSLFILETGTQLFQVLFHALYIKQCCTVSQQ